MVILGKTTRICYWTALITVERAAMLNSLGDLHFDLMVRNLLYGNTEHSEFNINALEVTQNNFAETGQF